METFDDFHARFRAKLRQLRAERGLLQSELEEVGISLGTFQHVEQGRHQPKLETLWRLAKAFGLRPLDLLDVEHVDPELSRLTRGGARSKGKPATKAQAPRRQRATSPARSARRRR